MTGRATTWDEETPLGRTRRARRIGRILESTYPDARCELDFRDPYELLIATVLSAQTTDVRVNGVTPELFARYPDARHLAAADRADVEEIIKPTGFFRAKTTSLIGLAQALCADFDGEVPDRLERLTTLPGVGRKTANVVLGNAFGVPGITVDTHVGRLARRMRLSVETDPVKVERDLMRVFEKRSWTQLCHVLIWHGRRRCHARRPACGACPVVRLCPSAGIGPLDPAVAAKLVRTQGRG